MDQIEEVSDEFSDYNEYKNKEKDVKSKNNRKLSIV